MLGPARRFVQILVLVALLLSLASLVLFLGLDRFVVTGTGLLEDPDFTDGFSHWRVIERVGTAEVRGHGAALAVPGPSGSVRISQVVPIPAGTTFVRVRADAKFRHPDDLDRKLALLSVVQLDEAGASRWTVMHPNLMTGKSTLDRSWTAVLRIADGTESLLFLAALRSGPATLRIAELGLVPVRESTLSQVSRVGLILSWSLLLGLSAALLLQQPQRRGRHVLVVAAGAAALIGVLTPGHIVDMARFRIGELWTTPESHGTLDEPPVSQVGNEPAAPSVSNRSPAEVQRGSATAVKHPVVSPSPAHRPGQKVAPSRASAADATPPSDSVVIRKASHLILFLVLTAAALWARPEERVSRVLFSLAAFAIVAEILQLFAVDRSPQPLDALVNLAGIAAGVLAVSAARRALGSRLSTSARLRAD